MSEAELTHPTIVDGWFREVSDEFPGQAMMLKVEKILYHEKSDFQDVLVFKSTTYGNVLVLDGIVQASERDEFAYQEMITNLGLYSHAAPKNVLVIGGGDGGVLRELVKDPGVESIQLCEIDAKVVEAAKLHLKDMSSGFYHPKVEVFIDDGFKFLARQLESGKKYDVIITDSSDPDGPAKILFSQEFFGMLKQALTPDGIIVNQGSENIWLQQHVIQKVYNLFKSAFPVVEYAEVSVPTYTSGRLGLFVCAMNPELDVTTPKRVLPVEEERKLWKYYNSRIHTASFVIPTAAELFIKQG